MVAVAGISATAAESGSSSSLIANLVTEAQQELIEDVNDGNLNNYLQQQESTVVKSSASAEQLVFVDSGTGTATANAVSLFTDDELQQKEPLFLCGDCKLGFQVGLISFIIS